MSAEYERMNKQLQKVTGITKEGPPRVYIKAYPRLPVLPYFLHPYPYPSSPAFLCILVSSIFLLVTALCASRQPIFHTLILGRRS